MIAGDPGRRKSAWTRVLASPPMPAPPCPPSADPLVAMADRCVQCGLCLPACPTYGLSRQEAESPRGRIALVRGWASGDLAPGPVGDAHLDHCLACRRCESVCPAGVPYGALLLAARVRQRGRRAPPWRQRWVEALVRRRWLLHVALALYRAMYPALPRSLRRLPRPPGRIARLPAAPLRDPDRADASLFVGCVAAHYEAPLRAALLRLCEGAGLAVRMPAGQSCCGAVHAHAGDAVGAARLGRRNRAAFERGGPVLALASGCRDALAAALGDGHEVGDAITWLEAAAPGLRFARRDARVALHLPCTQRRDPHAVQSLRRLLARVPGLVVIELDGGFGCCGAAGTQMLVDPAQAEALRAPLLEQVAASGVDAVLSANLGCRLHLANGTRLPVLHPLELLAAAAIAVDGGPTGRA